MTCGDWLTLTAYLTCLWHKTWVASTGLCLSKRTKNHGQETKSGEPCRPKCVHLPYSKHSQKCYYYYYYYRYYPEMNLFLWFLSMSKLRWLTHRLICVKFLWFAGFYKSIKCTKIIVHSLKFKHWYQILQMVPKCQSFGTAEELYICNGFLHWFYLRVKLFFQPINYVNCV